MSLTIKKVANNRKTSSQKTVTNLGLKKRRKNASLSQPMQRTVISDNIYYILSIMLRKLLSAQALYSYQIVLSLALIVQMFYL